MKKNFGPTRILYLFASLFLYFARTPSSAVKYSEKQFYITIPNSISDIKDNTFIFLDVADKYDFSCILRKCLKIGNVAFLKIDNLERANIFTKLGMKQLEGIFYFKNKDEIYDIFQKRKLTQVSKPLRNLDILILSRVVEFKAYLRKIGITRRFLEEVFTFILKNFMNSF